MAFQKYSEEKRNEILDSQQEKNARGKISLLLNLGFPKDWIEKMLPYINEDTTSWQLRMISLFDQDPEDLVAMLEDSVKNSSVEIFQSIRKKYYIEKKSSADIEQIQKSMEQYVPLIHNQLDAYNEMSALLQQQFAVQQEKDDLHKSKGDLQERINAMQKEHEKISIEKEDIFHQLQDYLYEVTGEKSRYYRFPGGSSNQISNVPMSSLIRFLNSEDVVYYDWNVSAGDAANAAYTPEELVENVVSDVSKYKTSVVLLHDSEDRSTTVEAVGPLIEALQDMDAEILPIDEDTQVIQYVKADSAR